MKVLWIVNIVFPAVAEKVGINTSTSGGWLLDLSKGISESEDIELGVMTYYNGDKFIDIKHDNIRHFLLPGGGKRLLHSNPKTGEDCKKIVELFKPDLIHIHGTEYAPGYEMLKVHPEIPSILTIQGILKRIAEEYFGGLNFKEIIKMTSFKQLLRGKLPYTYKRLYDKNAKRETEILKRVKYATGRTDWDKSTMLAINPKLNYFRCNYNLHDAFYNSEKWSVEKMTRHTIVTGAAHASFKGLHILIKALAIVKEKYPDVKLFIPGGGKAENGRLIAPNNYAKYALKLIKENNLDDNVAYLGNMKPEKVIEQLLKANICVVPSAIEGASATLREAMHIGTPSICSYRGGMTDLLTDKVSGFTYDYPEYSQLALRIMELFENDSLAEEFSKKSMEHAEKRHSRKKNIDDMLDVYREVMKNECK